MNNSTRQRSEGKKRLGQMLVEAGIIDEIQLTVALGAQNDSGLRLGKQLLKLGFVEERDLSVFLKDDTDLGVPLPMRSISIEALKAVPEELAFRHKVVPLAIVGKTLVLAIPDPKDLKTLDELSFVLGKNIQPVRAFEWEIESALLKFYKHFSDDELSKLTNISEAGQQYCNAAGAFGSEKLLQQSREDLNAQDTVPVTPPSTTQARPGRPPQSPLGRVSLPQRPAERRGPLTPKPLRGRPQPTTAPPAAAASPNENMGNETGSNVNRISSVLSDAAANLNSSDVLQGIIDLLLNKKLISENELKELLIKLGKGRK